MHAAWNKSQTFLTAGIFAQNLTSFTLCYYVIGLLNRVQTNHKHKRNVVRLWAAVSLGGSVTWHPKRTLQRSLIETLLELIMTKAFFLTLKSPDTHTYKTSPLRDLPFDCPEILPSEMSCGYPPGRSHEENNNYWDHNYENILWSTSIMIMNW